MPEEIALPADDGHAQACPNALGLAGQERQKLRFVDVDGNETVKIGGRHIGLGTHALKDLTGGVWPQGWYTGRDSPNTRRLVVDQGGYEYDSDYYGDDLPFWLQVQKTDGTLAPHLVVPIPVWVPLNSWWAGLARAPCEPGCSPSSARSTPATAAQNRTSLRHALIWGLRAGRNPMAAFRPRARRRDRA